MTTEYINVVSSGIRYHLIPVNKNLIDEGPTDTIPYHTSKLRERERERELLVSCGIRYHVIPLRGRVS